MLRSAWIKLAVLILVMSMLASLFVACDDEIDTGDDTGSEASETATSADLDETSDTETDSGSQGEESNVDDSNSESSAVESEESDSESESESDTEEETFNYTPENCGKHAFRDKNGSYHCIRCGYIPECKGVHSYIGEDQGHKNAACAICGKPEGIYQNHVYDEKVEDEGDLISYTFRCSVCKYVAYSQEVPYEINSFYSAGELAYTDVSGLAGAFGFDSGVGYAAYSAQDGGKMTLTVLANGEAEAPSGRFVVMKVRLPGSQTSFGISLRSVPAYKDKKLDVTFDELKAGWITLIVDLTKLATVEDVKKDKVVVAEDAKLGYHPDESGEYYLGDFTVTGTTLSEEVFGIAYILFCDTIEDAKSFTKDDKTVYIYEDALNSEPTVDQKPCLNPDGTVKEHAYIINPDGTHTMTEACYQCGLAAVENEPHTFAQMIWNGEMTYACKCGAQQFGEGAYINKYISAAEINSKSFCHNHFMLNREEELQTDPDGKFEYATYSGKNSTAQMIFVRGGYENDKYNEKEVNSKFNVGKANYFVMRMRTNDPANLKFNIHFGTEAAPLVAGKHLQTGSLLRFPTSLAKENEWTTYVVDLAAVHSTGYVANEDGTYTITNFFPHILSLSSETTFDIQFMAFVDDWNSEVAALTPDETCINVTGANTGTIVTSKDRKCVGAHVYADSIVEGVHAAVCSICGDTKSVTTVLSNVEKYLGPDVLMNATTNGGTLDQEIVTEGELSFVRLDNLQVKEMVGAWMGWNVINTTAPDVAGRYLVMKIRVGDNGLGNKQLKMYISTTKNKLENETQGVTFKVTEDGQWYTVVVDLAVRVGNADGSQFVAGEDGTYKVQYLQIRPFNDVQTKPLLDGDGNEVTELDSNGVPKKVMTTKPSPEHYLDIAYIAFCDELADLKDVVDTPTYEWSLSGTESTARNADGSCIQCVAPTEITPETVGSNLVYTVKCEFCGTTIKTQTVPASVVKFDFATNIADIKKWGNNMVSSGDLTLMSTATEIFARSVSRELFWCRSQADMANTQNSNQKIKTYDIGDAQFLVVRLRTSAVDRATTLSYSTEGKNRATSSDLSALETNRATPYRTVEGVAFQVVDDSDNVRRAYKYDSTNKVVTDEVLENVVYTTTGSSIKGIGIPFDKAGNDKWATYVINLSEVMGEFHAKAADADGYVVDSLYFTFPESYASGYLDFEYLAFASSWAEIDEMVKEDTVIKITESNVGEIVSAANGEAIPTT